jgi:hypothetical protein
MFELIKKGLKELVYTLSSKTSFLSSKRIERAVFTCTSDILIIATWIYLALKGILTATDTVMLITPLLLAAGYNLSKGEQSKAKELKNNEN